MFAIVRCEIIMALFQRQNLQMNNPAWMGYLQDLFHSTFFGMSYTLL